MSDSTTRQKSVKRKSAVREWFDSILFAVIAATLIRWLFFEAFVIPTPSMENSLLVGDYLFVSKLHYGTRTPRTPLQVPLTHQTIWGTKIPSYLDWIQLPSYRLPGFSEIKRGDAVVFNLPVEHSNQVEKYRPVLPDIQPHPVDLRVNYIKRCVAIAGDQLEVRNSRIYINGKLTEDPPGMESEYFMAVTTAVNESRIFKENGISEYQAYLETREDTLGGRSEQGYVVYTTASIAEKLRKYDFVKSVTKLTVSKSLEEPYLYPGGPLFKWNKDNYGPVVIPAKGMTIALTEKNIALYGEVIKSYEGNEGVKVEGQTIEIGGKPLQQYTFQQDYYFMMGDNRHNSADSRYWGFVPKDHVVGKAVFVWMSIDPSPTHFWEKIRWNRLFRVIH